MRSRAPRANHERARPHLRSDCLYTFRVSSNDRGDETEVTKPPVPRSRPGRPASSARRANDDTGSRPTAPGAAKHASTRAAATTTVDPPLDDIHHHDPRLDDTVETEQPTVLPPDPLLRAKIAAHKGNGHAKENGNGHAKDNGNGNGHAGNGHGNGTGHSTRPGNGAGNGSNSSSSGTSRNGAAPRAKSGSDTKRDPAVEGARIEVASVETSPAETRPTKTRPSDVPPVEAKPRGTTNREPAPAQSSSVARDLPPPLAPPSPDAILKSTPTSADTVGMNQQRTADISVVGQSPAEAPASPTASSWRGSLRKLLAKLPTAGPAATTEPARPAVKLEASAAPSTEPVARRSSTPITSPIPVQAPPSTGEALSPATTDPAQSLVVPFGLMPEQPPYIRPTPSFDPGMFRTGPVELDPSLDPDLPQRAPRVKPVRVPAVVRRRGRPRMRRVTRVVRHVDPWSVFKVALCFSLVLYGVCLTAGVLLWNVAYTTGTIDNVQRFFESFGWDTFRFKGGELYHNAWIAGLFCAIGLTGLIVLAATLFNLITDLVGGIRITVLEEEVIERDPAERRTLLRRRGRHSTSTVPATVHRDDEETIELYEHLG